MKRAEELKLVLDKIWEDGKEARSGSDSRSYDIDSAFHSGAYFALEFLQTDPGIERDALLARWGF